MEFDEFKEWWKKQKSPGAFSMLDNPDPGMIAFQSWMYRRGAADDLTWDLLAQTIN